MMWSFSGVADASIGEVALRAFRFQEGEPSLEGKLE